MICFWLGYERQLKQKSGFPTPIQYPFNEVLRSSKVIYGNTWDYTLHSSFIYHIIFFVTMCILVAIQWFVEEELLTMHTFPPCNAIIEIVHRHIWKEWDYRGASGEPPRPCQRQEFKGQSCILSHGSYDYNLTVLVEEPTIQNENVKPNLERLVLYNF